MKLTRVQGDLTRGAIVSVLLSGNINIQDIEERLKLDRPTIYHHLEVLEKAEIVIRNKDKTKRGSPVYLQIKIPGEVLEEYIKLYSETILEQSKILKNLKDFKDLFGKRGLK